MQQYELDPSGQGMTQGGWICGIVGTVLNGIAILIWTVILILYGGLFFFALQSTPSKSNPPPGNFSFEERLLPRWQDYQLPPIK